MHRPEGVDGERSERVAAIVARARRRSEVQDLVRSAQRWVERPDPRLPGLCHVGRDERETFAAIWHREVREPSGNEIVDPDDGAIVGEKAIDEV